MAISDSLQTNATTPAEAHGDMGGARQHPLPDQISADRYLAAKKGRGTRNRGLMFSKWIAAGPVSDSQGTRIGLSSFSVPGGLV